MPLSQRKPAQASTAPHGKYKLDELDATRIADHLVLFEPSEEVIIDLVAKARLSIPGMADTEEALKVQRHNSHCITAVARKSLFDPTAPAAEGFVAILPLNSLGMEILAQDAFDTSKPNVKFLAKEHERPKGIYWWCVYGPGIGVAGMALFMEKLASEQYAGLDIYARTVTEEGRNFLKVLGFTEGTQLKSGPAPHIWKFPRKPETPPYDSYVPHSGKKNIGITVARTFDDLMRVAAIRNAVYIGEQECPYDEEYDGNDLSATHLLAYVGDEPAGCLRLRFFAGFAKFERVAIRKEFRQSRAAIKLVNAGLKLCQKKGYQRVIGHAQIRLASFWTRFGFKPMEGRQSFVFSDYDYIEMVAELEQDPNAVTLGADPYLMIRPEGRWHVPGILEDSLSRPATNPSVTNKKN
jgi:predicted GNAT family N-acyltransferase